MARPLRIEYEGAVYHITSRGNARQSIFRDNQDRESFLATIEKVKKRYNWLCPAYCLMDNHYHLIIETPEGNLSHGMRQLNGTYTQSFNKRHKRVGHIFQGRYKAILIQKDSHLLEACRYVVLNPVRSKTVRRPYAWKWSSYKGTVGLSKPHPCLTTDWVLGQFAKRKWQARRAYREFVMAGIGSERIWNNVQGQSILGKEDFVEGLIDYVKGFRDVKEIPRSQRYVSRPGLDVLLGENIQGDRKKRNEKVREAVQKHGYSQKEVADHIGIHYSVISKLLKY
ncbi:MAG TPA: helix-turn-helix domain-containing protein [Nitrospirae bacterium]|nr:transposase IS200 like protein [bacterium BMS3Abin10]HDH50623.1 helix-turn-helix domain-containing protein [Nitrospirota bacterium]HDO26374.1 helix-turn-helix domain-containing protein [Nitrospirota bacterium]